MVERKGANKIALVGTSSVGKSTILEHFKQKFEGDPQVAFVNEAARKYFQNNRLIPLDERFSFGHQSKIQKLQLETEQNAQNSRAKTILCDRSVLDAPVYVRAHGDMLGSKRLVDSVRFWIPTYSHIVLLDPNQVAYLNDEIRQEDQEIRMKNHEAFIQVFMEEGIPYELLGGSLDQRIERVGELVSESV